MSTASKAVSMKLILCGNATTGKTSLLRRYVDDIFSEDMVSTVGVEFNAKIVTLDGEKVKLCCWDTCGQEVYKSLTRSYMRGAVGALIVYDVTNKDTFDAIPRWLADLRQLAGEDVVVMLVGNKTDLCGGGADGSEDRREVPHTKASIYAQENGLMHMETSAATGDFVPEAFLRVARTALQKMRGGGGGAAGGTGIGGGARGGQKSRLLNDDDDEMNSPHEGAGGSTGSPKVNLAQPANSGAAAAGGGGGMCSRC